MLKMIVLALGALAAVTGIVSAWKWYLASKVEFSPFEKKGGRLMPLRSDDVQVWLPALTRGLKKSGTLNKQAARWTAASAVLAGLSVVVDALGHLTQGTGP